MYGHILKLDAGRQQRVGTDVLKKLLSKEAYQALQNRPRGLNASLSDTVPFAPTLMRPAMYPERFRVTEIRTLFWKLKNMDGLHHLCAITFSDPEHIVFTFNDTPAEEELTHALEVCNHTELGEPKKSGKTVTYTILPETYGCCEEEKEE